MTRHQGAVYYRWRAWVMVALLSLGLGLLFLRAVYLQVLASDYLQAQGEARYSRVEKVVATRGMIVD